MCEFSVIIPTYDRPRLLAACVESVLAQDFPAERYEVIVVDDGSRIPTARVLGAYVRSGRVRLLRQRRQGWGAARLLGARDSRGAILAFIDDDCVAPPGWLACYARVYAERLEADGVGGGLRPDAWMNVAGRKQYLGHLARFNRLNAPLGIRADQAGWAWFTFGGNRTLRRGVWLATQAKARTSWYYDDYLIDLQLREMGAHIYYEPAAWVTHHYVLSVVQRVRAAYRYGQSEARVGASVAERERVGGEAAAPLGKWRRLTSEVAGAPVPGLVWYAMTQPLVWLARWIGQLKGSML